MKGYTEVWDLPLLASAAEVMGWITRQMDDEHRYDLQMDERHRDKPSLPIKVSDTEFIDLVPEKDARAPLEKFYLGGHLVSMTDEFRGDEWGRDGIYFTINAVAAERIETLVTDYSGQKTKISRAKTLGRLVCIEAYPTGQDDRGRPRLMLNGHIKDERVKPFMIQLRNEIRRHFPADTTAVTASARISSAERERLEKIHAMYVDKETDKSIGQAVHLSPDQVKRIRHKEGWKGAVRNKGAPKIA